MLYTIAGSLLMLLALMGVYLVHGQYSVHFSFALMKLVGTPYPGLVELVLFAAFALAFVIKVPLVPLHTWLPDAHTEAPTAGSIILAGVLLKTGTYALLRIAFPLFPYAAKIATPWIMALGLAGMFYAGWIALAQQDLKRLVAYSSIAHMGLIIVGLTVWSQVGQVVLLEDPHREAIAQPMSQDDRGPRRRRAGCCRWLRSGECPWAATTDAARRTADASVLFN